MDVMFVERERLSLLVHSTGQIVFLPLIAHITPRQNSSVRRFLGQGGGIPVRCLGKGALYKRRNLVHTFVEQIRGEIR